MDILKSMDISELLDNSKMCSFCNLFSAISSLMNEQMVDHVKKGHSVEKIHQGMCDPDIVVQTEQRNDDKKSSGKVTDQDDDGEYSLIAFGKSNLDGKVGGPSSELLPENIKSKKSGTFFSKPEKGKRKKTPSDLRRNVLRQKKHLERKNSPQGTTSSPLINPPSKEEPLPNPGNISTGSGNSSATSKEPPTSIEIIRRILSGNNSLENEDHMEVDLQPLPDEVIDTTVNEPCDILGDITVDKPVPVKNKSRSNTKANRTSSSNELKNGVKKHKLMKHSNKKDHICQVCGKEYTIIAQLKRHLLVHQNDTPFSCEHCGKGFKAKSRLQEHVTIHTGKKPYECGYCGKRVRSDIFDHLKHHQSQNHPLQIKEKRSTSKLSKDAE